MGYILTGSIATGKSSVAELLAEKGFKIIDADKIARELIDPEIINELFGKKYIRDGIIDREALGKLIFSDKKEREKLNSYLHPLIREEIYKRKERLIKEGKNFLIDIPLFFESEGAYEREEGVVLVYAPKSVAIKRLIKRNFLNEEEAIKRVEAQMDIEKKRELSDFIIDNSGDFENLKREVERFYASIEI